MSNIRGQVVQSFMFPNILCSLFSENLSHSDCQSSNTCLFIRNFKSEKGMSSSEMSPSRASLAAAEFSVIPTLYYLCMYACIPYIYLKNFNMSITQCFFLILYYPFYVRVCYCSLLLFLLICSCLIIHSFPYTYTHRPVSYTHLTLPTRSLV